MGVFGWSYPPGCSGPPEYDETCEMCGNQPDDCVCPECPKCSGYGDPYCYDEEHVAYKPVPGIVKVPSCGMIMTNEQVATRIKNELIWEQEAAAEEAYLADLMTNPEPEELIEEIYNG